METLYKIIEKIISLELGCIRFKSYKINFHKIIADKRMGIIRMGVPTDLVSQLALQFNIKNFVETGTYYADTAFWASKVFDKVITIEYSQDLYEIAKIKYRDIANIEFLFGDSRKQLNEIIQRLDNSAVFWLDAHWSGGSTYGENDQCPLIEEINIINNSQFDHFILIDDARLFTSTPQPPQKIDQWPNISEVIDALRVKSNDKYIVIIEDVIIAVPNFAKSSLANYCQDINDKAWKEYGDSCRKSNLSKGLELIIEDISSRFKSLAKKIKKS
jgi:hypothetical protein